MLGETFAQLFRKYRLMFPTIDNVKSYLEKKQWDRLLKEYNKYKSVIVTSQEQNIVIEMVGVSSSQCPVDQRAHDGVHSPGHLRDPDAAVQLVEHAVSGAAVLSHQHRDRPGLRPRARAVYGAERAAGVETRHFLLHGEADEVRVSSRDKA